MVDVRHDAGVLQIQAFIDQDSSEVVIIRTEKVDDGAGGKIRQGPEPLDPQTMRLTRLTRTRGDAPRVSADGNVVDPTWTLTARPGADIKRGDETTVNDHKLEIVFVSNEPSWVVNAECVEHA